jgi:hypothetical protein
MAVRGNTWGQWHGDRLFNFNLQMTPFKFRMQSSLHVVQFEGVYISLQAWKMSVTWEDTDKIRK